MGARREESADGGQGGAEGWRGTSLNLASTLAEGGGRHSGAEWSVPMTVEETREGRRFRVRLRGGECEEVSLSPRQSWLDRLLRYTESVFMPTGYPHTVTREFNDYMAWRGAQHFFGGAIGVLTTRSLLGAVGASRGAGMPRSEHAAAVSWVLKDGVGRAGKMLFGRFGQNFDTELKSYRFGASVLLNIGAILEIGTALVPGLFLPIASAAQLVKGAALITVSSTRAPIYREFALANNLADITAKGESLGTLSDLLGTAFGIKLSNKVTQLAATAAVKAGGAAEAGEVVAKAAATPRGGVKALSYVQNRYMFGAAALLSVAYLISSYLETMTVVLPTVNVTRFDVVFNHFLATGEVLGPVQGNRRERLIPRALNPNNVELGCSVVAAFPNGDDLRASREATGNVGNGHKYVIGLRRDILDPRFAVVLEEGCTERDQLRALFHAKLVQKRAQESGILRKISERHRFERKVFKEMQTAARKKQGWQRGLIGLGRRTLGIARSRKGKEGGAAGETSDTEDEGLAVDPGDPGPDRGTGRPSGGGGGRLRNWTMAIREGRAPEPSLDHHPALFSGSLDGEALLLMIKECGEQADRDFDTLYDGLVNTGWRMNNIQLAPGTNRIKFL